MDMSSVPKTGATGAQGDTVLWGWLSPCHQDGFHGLVNAMFSHILCFLLISFFKTAPKYSPEVLATAHEYKARMCLLEKMQVFAKLCSGISYSTAGQDLNVNESLIFNKVLLKRNTYKTRLCTDQLMTML